VGRYNGGDLFSVALEGRFQFVDEEVSRIGSGPIQPYRALPQ